MFGGPDSALRIQREALLIAMPETEYLAAAGFVEEQNFSVAVVGLLRKRVDAFETIESVITDSEQNAAVVAREPATTAIRRSPIGHIFPTGRHGCESKIVLQVAGVVASGGSTALDTRSVTQ
jgi:hypothetical protein